MIRSRVRAHFNHLFCFVSFLALFFLGSVVLFSILNFQKNSMPRVSTPRVVAFVAWSHAYSCCLHALTTLVFKYPQAGGRGMGSPHCDADVGANIMLVLTLVLTLVNMVERTPTNLVARFLALIPRKEHLCNPLCCACICRAWAHRSSLTGIWVRCEVSLEWNFHPEKI